MANGKDRHYWCQLRTALTAGQWSSPTPAKTPKGIPLSWSELLRKFNKHARGFSEVAEVASQTQALALFLDCTHDYNGSSLDGPLDLGDECVLPEERIEEGNQALKVLNNLKGSNFDSLQLARAYYAYALGRPSECLTILAALPDLPDVQSHIPVKAGTTRSNTTTLTIPTNEASSTNPTSSVGSAESGSSVADINDGRAWAMTETIRSICLQGMSHEKLSRNDSEKALQAYTTALPLITIVKSEIPRIVPATGSGKLDFSSFTRFRELWIWIERTLWRAIILSSRSTPLTDQSLWTLFSHYRTCSLYWPNRFNTEHRSTIAVLHLRALVLRARIPSTRPVQDHPPAWLSDARAVVHEYRAILSKCTHFPKAGERNIKVEDFVDLCVAVWEASGAIGDHAGWVIDILWWATRLTFNSHRIFRHMTRLFYVSGDTQLARRTLRLYVQVVSKASQAGGAGVGVDADTDRHWVETLVQGARMLCRLAGPNGVEEAREAGELIEKAKTRLDLGDKELAASVSLAEGIWSAVLALVDHEPRLRPSRLQHSLAQFAASIQTFPTPSAYYHLAIALARPGPQQDLDQAITSASSAVEGASGDIRYWHLLGLLLTANGKWTEAKGVLDIGAALGEKGDSDTSEDGHEGEREVNQANRVQIRDFATATPESSNRVANGHVDGVPGTPPASAHDILLLGEDSTMIPPPATLLQPIPDCPALSQQDAFECALQLRMSQVALAECVEGAEGAGVRWVEVFAWVAERKGVVTAEQHQASMDASRVAEDTRQQLDYIHAQASDGSHAELSHSSEKQHLNGLDTSNGTYQPTTTPSVMVTPATPAADTQTHFMSEKRSTSMDQESSKGKKVQQMLKSRVHKSQARISTISKKIGNGMVKKDSSSLRRTNSAPDFHTFLQHKPYQASSIHSRQRLSFIRQPEPSLSDSPPPPPRALSPARQETKWNNRVARENRILSNLWLMSAATFRRLGKIEQAKGAIQESEVKDEDNPAVWVQLGLYYIALGHNRHAIDAFHKALFISPDDISATVHICRVYLSLSQSNQKDGDNEEVQSEYIDLVAGMLSHAVKGAAWDVPEAWYFLAKAYGSQGRKDKEREALTLALSLSERRCIRDIGVSVGWCL